MHLQAHFWRKRYGVLWRPHPGALWKRYVIALMVITTVISVSHLATLAVLRAGANHSEMINVSGRQRMLSQRAMYFVHEYSHSGNPTTKQDLRRTIELFEKSHAWLTTHPDLPDLVTAQFFKAKEKPLDPFARQFATLVRAFIDSEELERPELQRQIDALMDQGLLAALNETVRLIEIDAQSNLDRMLTLQKIAFAVALLVLLLEAIFIYMPAQFSVTRAVSRLQKRGRLLEKSLRALKARNAQLIAARHDLDHAANHDALTGLFNRRALLQSLSAKLDRQPTEDDILGLLKIDLDYFKAVNDCHGHAAGDQVLKEVAARLSKNIGPYDIVARIGGDEFVMIVEKAGSVGDLRKLAEDKIVRLRHPIETDSAICQVGASIGLTIISMRDATHDQLLLEADLALFEAKRAGRNRVHVYSEHLQHQLTNRNALFSEITQALENNQFTAFMQPQINVVTGALYGCEMLARWHHPRQGIVPPSVFLDAAREAGLLRKIDLQVTSKALDQLERLRADGLALPQVSVNACAETLRDPRYVDWLQEGLGARGLSGANLVVEILESTLIQGENDRVLRTVEGLANAGIRVYLDDFGTGYATMATLSHLRLAGIKIDRSLIDPLPANRARSIVAALVALSRNLDMKVVAEGVESERHFAAVSELECDFMQGFGIGKPMSEEGFRRWHSTFADAADADADFTKRLTWGR
ncbi:MAG: EAL domain-containing protein [Pseudomonadota bacterium]